MTLTQKEMVNQLKSQWKKLWQEKVDDHVKAEAIAITDYSSLFVDQGTIIHATRDFKALTFKEILEQYQVQNPERYIPPSPAVGGWNKFIKTKIVNSKKGRRANDYVEDRKEIQQPKKGGRGWLHK